MTDLDRMLAFLDGAGVLYLAEGHEDGTRSITFGQVDEIPGVRQCPKMDGYPYFYTFAVFTSDGTLDKIGAWE